MVYFISDQDSKKGKDPKIHIIDGIDNINRKTYVNVSVSNYTNKHIIYNKGKYVGHLELPTEDMQLFPENPESLATHNITTERMMAEKVEPDTFNPAHYKLKEYIEIKLEELFKEYQSQFTQDETTIGITPLFEMTIDTGVFEPVSQKPYPIAIKHHKWVKEKITKLPTAKVIQGRQSSWSTPIIVVPKEDGWKHLVISYCALNKITWKHFFQLNGAKYFSTLDLWAGYYNISLEESSIPKTAFTSPFRKYKYIKVSLRFVQATAYFQELLTGILKDIYFTIAYLDDIIIFR